MHVNRQFYITDRKNLNLLPYLTDSSTTQSFASSTNDQPQARSCLSPFLTTALNKYHVQFLRISWSSHSRLLLLRLGQRKENPKAIVIFFQVQPEVPCVSSCFWVSKCILTFRICFLKLQRSNCCHTLLNYIAFCSTKRNIWIWVGRARKGKRLTHSAVAGKFSVLQSLRPTAMLNLPRACQHPAHPLILSITHPLHLPIS